jgi:aldose 1-epimerase
MAAVACGCAPAAGPEAVQEQSPAKPEAVQKEPEAKMSVEKTLFGQMPDGRPVDLYTLSNGAGMKVRVINYGATLVGVDVPDRQGKIEDVTLGHDTLEGWLSNRGSFGATIGRYGNRIAKARFVLDGQTFALTANAGEHHLHGGVEGFSKKLWTAEPVQAAGTVGVRLTYTSPDGEEGYPGTLRAEVVYALKAGNELSIEMTAVTDKPTVVNLVNHTYWNLGGPSVAEGLGHELWLNADLYTVAGPDRIPTGELAPVRGTPLDFTTPATLGARIAETGGGYDHNLVLRGRPGEVRRVARVTEPTSGRTMELYTDQPGVQLFSMNFPDGFVTGKGGAVYRRHGALCLETQHYPDSPNHDNFPSTILWPGETYRHAMIFRFLAK